MVRYFIEYQVSLELYYLEFDAVCLLRIFHLRTPQAHDKELTKSLFFYRKQNSNYRSYDLLEDYSSRVVSSVLMWTYQYNGLQIRGRFRHVLKRFRGRRNKAHFE